MSDDEADPELLQLLRQHLGMTRRPGDGVSSDTGVLRNAEFIYANAIDVSIDMYGTRAAAANIYHMMRERGHSTEAWSKHELHPKTSEGFTELDIVNFVFTLDLQNYSFWSERSHHERYQVEYRGRRWTGYNSLVACLRRALDEGIPITTPRFWRSQPCTDELLKHVFRSATAEPIPLLEERIAVLRQSSTILHQEFPADGDEDEVATGAEDHGLTGAEKMHTVDGGTPQDLPEYDATSGNDSGTRSKEPESRDHLPSSHQAEGSSTEVAASNQVTPLPSDAVRNSEPSSPEGPSETRTADHRPDHAVVRLIQKSEQSAGKLVNLLAHRLPCFRDETRFEGRKVRFLKRAQIFVADLWAALHRTGLGKFHDIDHLTMFADYRVPQLLHALGVLTYSPPLDHHIRHLKAIEPGHSWEVQLRGCSIWAVELMRREILHRHPEATSINAVLIDFFLYDLAKEKESLGQLTTTPHHRTRSIWY